MFLSVHWLERPSSKWPIRPILSGTLNLTHSLMTQTKTKTKTKAGLRAVLSQNQFWSQTENQWAIYASVF